MKRDVFFWRKGKARIDSGMTLSIWNGEATAARPLTLRQKLRAIVCAKEEGSQLVEMAVVAPILLVILTGMASFGMALYSQQQLGLAAANAVQAVATGASLLSNSDPCLTAKTDVVNSLPGWNASSFSYSMKIYTSSSTSVTATSGSGGSFTCSGTDYTDMTQNQPIVLTVTYPYSWFPILTWSKYGSSFSPSGSLTTTQAAMVQ